MKVEYVSPFAEAAISVFEMLIQETPSRGQLKALPTMFTGQQINVMCGVTGSIQGLVIYGMSVTTADRIASRMIGQPVVTFDALASSAIAELGNMISGHSATALMNQGFQCDITPPTIIRGTNVKVSTYDVPALVIPLEFAEIGRFEISVSLNERVAKQAA
jgi:chemotaxis protein CheX